MKFPRTAVCVLALLAAPLAATAQDYPNRAIRMIVPLSPGGATDAMVRSVAPRMSATLGGAPVVEADEVPQLSGSTDGETVEIVGM